MTASTSEKSNLKYSLSIIRRRVARVIGILLLVFLAFVFFMPFYWMLSTSLKDVNYVFVNPPQWFPKPIMWSNFAKVFVRMDLAKYITNTVIVATLPVIGEILSAPMIAYSLTIIPWKGQKFIFPIILVTMMIPWQVTQIPMYTIWKNLGFVNTFIPLVLPAFFGGGFYIYLLRQFMRSMPNSIIEAARLDGAGELKILYIIVYPLCKPILATIAVLIFISGWNDFNGPLLYLQTSSNYTLSIGLQMFMSTANPEWNLLMAASTLFTIPLIVIFFCSQKAFLSGISTTSGLK